MLKNIAFLFFITLIAAGCSSVKVTSDYDKTTDFSQYKTFEYYGWANESDKVLNQFDKERLEQALGEEFAKRGLQYVKEGGDLIVSLFLVIDQKTSVTAYTDHYGAGYGYRAGWGWYGGYGTMGGTSTTHYTENDYLEGTLVVDVFDKAKKNEKGEVMLIWQGVGQKTIEENPKNRERSIKYSAEAIMRPFPLKPIVQKK